MVIGGVSREWSIRLARLHELVAAGAQGPMWLWRIRIRILSYLLTRYGEPQDPAPPQSGVDRPDTMDEPWSVPPETVSPVAVAYALPPTAVEHPPKAATVITPFLYEIQAVNTALRAARWEDPSPEQVWQWWRTAWCRRP